MTLRPLLLILGSTLALELAYTLWRSELRGGQGEPRMEASLNDGCQTSLRLLAFAAASQLLATSMH